SKLWRSAAMLGSSPGSMMAIVCPAPLPVTGAPAEPNWMRLIPYAPRIWEGLKTMGTMRSSSASMPGRVDCLCFLFAARSLLPNTRSREKLEENQDEQRGAWGIVVVHLARSGY